MITLFETKAEFANILSETGVTVIQSPKAKTASFHIKTRVLTLPIFTDMAEETYNGFVIHEIGHALFTDEEIIALSVKYGKGALGILEDVRCNNLMKERFGGATPIFRKHYDILSKCGFFGKREDFEKYNILDKINVLNKTRFTAEGFPDVAELWNKIKDIKTHEDIENALITVKAFQEENKDTEDESHSDDMDHSYSDDSDDDVEYEYDPNAEETADFDDSEDDSESEESEDDSDEESEDDSGAGEDDDSDEESEDEESEDDDSDEESEDDDSESDDGSGKGSEESEDDTDEESEDDSESEADEVSDDTEDEIDLSELESEIEKRIEDEFSGEVSNETRTYFIPKEYDLKSIIVPFTDMKVSDNKSLSNDNRFNKFEIEIRPIVKQMVSAYNRNKSAKSFRRKKVTRTGALDLKKLHLYKTSEDIFKRVTNTSKGKNHGVMFMLDMSGSMSGKNGIVAAEQLVIMGDFCKAINVPFRVMGFWSHNEQYSSSYHDELLDVDPYTLTPSRDFKLIELLSNKMSKDTFAEFRKNLYSMSHDWTVDYTAENVGRPIRYSGGTHMYNTAIVAPQLVEEFKRDNAVEICNFILFADGGNSFDPYSFEYDENTRYLRHEVNFSAHFGHDIQIIDQKTKAKATFKGNETAQNTVSEMMKLVKARTNANTMFMYLTGKAAYSKEYIENHSSKAKLESHITWDEVQEYNNKLKVEKFVELPNKEGADTKIIYVTTDMSFASGSSSVKHVNRSHYKSEATAMTAIGREWIKSQGEKKSKVVFAKLVAESISKYL